MRAFLLHKIVIIAEFISDLSPKVPFIGARSDMRSARAKYCDI